LLPAADRRARGEELVGVLMDVSTGRSRPAAAEVLPVVFLALRQRLRSVRGAVAFGLTALLVAHGTLPVGIVTVADFAPAESGWWTVLQGLTFLPVLATAAWLVGWVRTALVAYAMIAVPHAGLILYHFRASLAEVHALAVYALVLALLVGGWRRWWSPPRPRAGWLATAALCALAWVAFVQWVTWGDPLPPAATTWFRVSAAVLAAVVAGALARPHRWPVVAAAAVVGSGATWVVSASTAVREALTSTGVGLQPYAMALVVVAVMVPVHLLATPRDRQPERLDGVAA
jgi:hypothetical protein